MFRILVVDDEEKIRALIRKYAEFEGNQVTEAQNGMEAVELCRRHPEAFDIIIMDVMMPELDGFSAVKEIRKTCSTPVLMLSARGEEYDRIHGFELGVDDYVVKPFSPKELMMRVTAIMNRVRPREAEPKRNVLTFQGLSIDLDARIVTVDGVRAELSPKEYDLLVYMARILLRDDRRIPFPVRREHRSDPGDADHQRVGLRFLRRRPHPGHPHQAAAPQPGPLQQVHCHPAGRGLPV